MYTLETTENDDGVQGKGKQTPVHSYVQSYSHVFTSTLVSKRAEVFNTQNGVNAANQ